MPATEITPARCIVPIIKLNAANKIIALSGTGFFITSVPKPTLVTAKHVLTDNSPASGERHGFVYLQSNGEPTIATINRFNSHPRLDIAAVLGCDLDNIESLQISRTLTSMNADVFTYEFSQSTLTALPDGSYAMHVSPFTHKGNIMRYYTSTYPEPQPVPVFDTSFPALQGASGAPVVRGSDLAIVGMLVANHERHLVPAQIVKADLGDKQYEEVRYFLPTGKAVQASVIVDFLESLGAQPTVVE